MLRDYVRIRLEIARDPHSLDEIIAAISASNAIQQKLWRLAMDAGAADPRSVSLGLYIDSLNAIIDLQETG